MVKLTSLGSKILVEYGDKKPFSVDPEEIEFEINGENTVAFNILGGVPIELSDIEIDGSTPTNMTDFKEKVSEVFNEPGQSGGSTGLFPTQGEGHATGDVSADLDGNTLSIKNGGIDQVNVSSTSSKFGTVADEFEDNYAKVSFFSDVNSSDASIGVSHGGTKTAGVTVEANAERSTTTISGDFKSMGSLPEFADNAAAISGGLEEGMLYHTAGVVKIVLPVE
jgi:hypothetical protein